MTRTVTVALLLLAVLAPPAEGRHRIRMSFPLAVEIAVDYWAKHHVTIPCRPTRRLLSFSEADALDAAFGRGVTMAYQDSCEVEITPTGESYRTDRDLMWLYCTDAVHEIGHIAGLAHSYGGVMANPPVDVPWACGQPRRFLRMTRYRRDGFVSREWPRSEASRIAGR